MAKKTQISKMDPWESRKALAKPLLVTVLVLQVAHCLLVLCLPRPVLLSNLLQLCFPVLAAFISFFQGFSNRNRVGRRCWVATGSAFMIWAAAQVLFIYFIYKPAPRVWSVRPDDALWVLFGLPLILAVTNTVDEADQVAWLDRAQAFLFFAMLYLLVFLPSSSLAVTKAYLIQNFALVLCCFLRLPTSTLAPERRFFLHLTAFLLAYSVLESIGELLYHHGWQPGSLVDLVWSSPITLFLVLVLRDALRKEDKDQNTSRLAKAVGTSQGLSLAALTFLSIVVTALITSHKPVLGGFMLAGTFLLFALRTNARERLWHQAHRRLEQTVLRDALTGLGNRLQLHKCLTERLATANGVHIALLFVDLDRFKQINDSLGHALGDCLLTEVGQRLCAAAPPSSIVCRLGGDEFVVLTEAKDQQIAQTIADNLLSALHTSLQIGTHDLRCTASIGLVLADAGEDADELLRTADQAMYRAKQLGRNRIQLFDAALRTQMNSRWRMEAELRRAVEKNEIQVAFQPIYSVEQAGICGFEALARWSHPVLGNVPPTQFIPLAEESGLILALGNQVLEKACAQVAGWNSSWGTAFAVSVNVSPRQFADASLLPSLLKLLDKTGLPPTLLRLEITETALLTHESVVKHTLEQARAHGIRISLDDFGTGYSSLSFLLSLPVDEVKVDRSFVSHMHQDPDREELVRTVIHLGHSLGKRVVAEGVETEQDLLGLAKMGCECVQGYLISKPLTPEALEADLSTISARSMSVAAHGFQEARQERRPARTTPVARPAAVVG